MKNRLSPSIAAACVYAAMGSGTAPAADLEKIDWSAVPKSEIVLFYPGQSSHQWLLSAEHGGNKAVRNGKNCLECHKGEEAEIGKTIASGKKT